MRPGPKPRKATCGHDAPNFAKGKCARCYRRDFARETYRRVGWPAHLKRKYGISLAAYEGLVLRQKGRCAICKGGEGPLHIDHDHKTGRVRGLLCGSCNRGLGMFKESIASLLSAAGYLAKEAA